MSTSEVKARAHPRYLKFKASPAYKAKRLAATKRWQAKQGPEKMVAAKAVARLRAARTARTRSPRPYANEPNALVKYLALLTHQDQRCAICKIHFETSSRKRNPRAVDHDHTTNKIRGILCINCNLLLGHAKDNPMILRNAVKYLENQ